MYRHVKSSHVTASCLFTANRGQKVIQTRPTSTSLCGEICITPPKYLRYERRRDFFLAVVLSWRRCVFPNTVRGVTFLTHARGIRPITTHFIAGQSEHTSLFRTMNFVKIDFTTSLKPGSHCAFVIVLYDC